jgi:hypothetical protein
VYQGDTSKVNSSLYTAIPADNKLPESKVINGNNK